MMAKAIVIGKVKKEDGELVDVDSQIDVKLTDKGELPPSLVNKVRLVESVEEKEPETETKKQTKK